MRKARVYMHDQFAGILSEKNKGGPYQFHYEKGYEGPPVSLTMPVGEKLFTFSEFPPFFEGLLPHNHPAHRVNTMPIQLQSIHS